MNKKAKKIALGLGYFCTALGLIFAIFWMAGVRENKKMLKICNGETEGFVARIEQKAAQRTGSDDDSYYYYDVTEYAAVYQYEVNSVTYENTSQFSSSKPRFQVNTRVAIRYNPKNPQVCFVPADPHNKSTGFVVFTCLLLAMGVASFVKVYTSKES